MWWCARACGCSGVAPDSKDLDPTVSAAFTKYTSHIAEKTAGGGHGHDAPAPISSPAADDSHHGHSHAGGVCGPDEKSKPNSKSQAAASHGHSHAGGSDHGHSHSHGGGGDDDHGHSHSGGGSHGHSHGSKQKKKGGASASLEDLMTAGGDDHSGHGGGHGHSHGGKPCGGHGGPPSQSHAPPQQPQKVPAIPGSKKLVSYFSPLPNGVTERKQAIQALAHVAELARDPTHFVSAVILAQPPVTVINALEEAVTTCIIHMEAVHPLPVSAINQEKMKEKIPDAKKRAAEIKRIESVKPSKVKLTDAEIELVLVYGVAALADYALIGPVRAQIDQSRNNLNGAMQCLITHHKHITNRAVMFQALRLISNLGQTANRAEESFVGYDFLDTLSSLIVDPTSKGAAAATTTATAAAAGDEKKSAAPNSAQTQTVWDPEDVRREAARVIASVTITNGTGGQQLAASGVHIKIADLLLANLPKADVTGPDAIGAQIMDSAAYYGLAVIMLSAQPAMYKSFSSAVRDAMFRVAFAIKSDSPHHVAAINAVCRTWGGGLTRA